LEIIYTGASSSLLRNGSMGSSSRPLLPLERTKMNGVYSSTPNQFTPKGDGLFPQFSPIAFPK